MILEEEDDDEMGGVYPRHRYDKAENVVDTRQAERPDACECYMDHPNPVETVAFDRGVNLDG